MTHKRKIIFANLPLFCYLTKQCERECRWSLLCCRLWYVTASARKAAGAAEQQNSSVPVEIGYMNVIPKCLDSSGKYPVYENLPETYAAINSYLADNPLEGFTLLEFVSHQVTHRVRPHLAIL